MLSADAVPVTPNPCATDEAWRIDADVAHGRLTVTLHPASGTEDFVAAMLATRRAAASPTASAVLVDLLELQRAPSLDEARRLGDAVGSVARSLAAPVALLASRVVVYGVARMIASFAEVHGGRVGVFRTADDALAWTAREAEAIGRKA